MMEPGDRQRKEVVVAWLLGDGVHDSSRPLSMFSITETEQANLECLAYDDFTEAASLCVV